MFVRIISVATHRTIQVRLFGAAKQLAGAELIAVECPEPGRVEQLRESLQRHWPSLRELLRHTRIAVNAEYVDDAKIVDPCDEVACIPPVSGG